MKQVIITVNPDGTVKVDGKGFVGAECDKAMKAFEDALGQETSRKKKPEWYSATATNNTQRT